MVAKNPSFESLQELLADKYFGLVADVKEDGSYIIRGTFMLEVSFKQTD